MTDLTTLLPSFASETHAHLLPTLEQQGLTTADLLSLDARTVAARTRLPVLDIARLLREIGAGLRADLGFAPTAASANLPSTNSSGYQLAQREWNVISTLDDSLDAVLGGGVPAGYVTEVVGERYVVEHWQPGDGKGSTWLTMSISGAGKTQFLLTLLLAAQLPPPHGLGRPTIYISTEHALPTQRLAQMLASNPQLATAVASDTTPAPSLARILTLHTPDLETQEHILAYQLPVALSAHNPGLIVLDSIAANYRDAPAGAAGLAARAASLQRTGALLQDLARKHDCAVVVSNHVADRFGAQIPIARGLIPSHYAATTPFSQGGAPASSSPPSSILDINGPDLPRSQMTASPGPLGQHSGLECHPALTLDHQQRFFTGWGADPCLMEDPAAKTPALGLVWANQIAARIAIVKEAAWVSAGEESSEVNKSSPYVQPSSLASAQKDVASTGASAVRALPTEVEPSAEWTPRRWRRWMRLVFAAWAAGTPARSRGVEFKIYAGGVQAMG